MGWPHPIHAKETPVLSTHFGEAEARTFDGWVKRCGYEALKRALGMEPAAITEGEAALAEPITINPKMRHPLKGDTG